MTGTIKVSPDKLLSTSAEFSSQGNTIISLRDDEHCSINEQCMGRRGCLILYDKVQEP